MTREQVYEQLNEIFADVFNREGIALTDATTAADVQGWDSLIHITLLGAVEDEFDIQFDMKQVVELKNVGDMVDAILALV